MPHAALIAYKLKKPMVFTRLESGMSKPTDSRKRVVEGVLTQGSNLVLIEDHVTTGLTVLDSVEALKEQGGKVALCVSITDDGLEETSRKLKEQDVPLFSLTSLNEIVRHAAEVKRINGVHTRAIERWQADPWSFSEWLQRNGHTPLSITVERPVVISNLTFNSSSTFGYHI